MRAFIVGCLVTLLIPMMGTGEEQVETIEIPLPGGDHRAVAKRWYQGDRLFFSLLVPQALGPPPEGKWYHVWWGTTLEKEGRYLFAGYLMRDKDQTWFLKDGVVKDPRHTLNQLLVAVGNPPPYFSKGLVPPPSNFGNPVLQGAFPLLPSEPPPRRMETMLSEIGDAITGHNEFAFRLYRTLEKEPGNHFVSPYSLSGAFAMVYEGARGETAAEIETVFHLSPTAELRSEMFAAARKGSLQVANALWTMQGHPFLKDYRATVQQHYGAKLGELNFLQNSEKARHTINRWVDTATSGKIKTLFPPDSLPNTTRLVLTNAIYFRGRWASPFDPKRTREEPFWVTPKESVLVPMMRQTSDATYFPYAETDRLQILELPYQDELSMFVLLPKGQDLSKLTAALTLEKFEGWKSKLQKQRVDVYLPRFHVATRYDEGPLKKMGLSHTFSPDADFSGMDGTQTLFINVVIHQAQVTVDETGTEAAAASAVVGALKGESPPAPLFRADHPFLFIIQDKNTGIILFLGKFTHPNQNH